jgi:hypothetical protein
MTDDPDFDALRREAIEALLSNAEFVSGGAMSAPLSNGWRVEYDPAGLQFRVVDEDGAIQLEGEMPHFLNSGEQ